MNKIVNEGLWKNNAFLHWKLGSRKSDFSDFRQGGEEAMGEIGSPRSRPLPVRVLVEWSVKCLCESIYIYIGT
jgi:hypothetical protein